MSKKINKKDDKNTSLNIKIAIITAVVIVWVICLAVMLSKCDSDKGAENANTPTDTITDITTYESAENGKISKGESKTVAYLDSHFKASHYRVKEIEISSAQEGTYYITEVFTYSTDGYVYRRTSYSTYAEREYTDSTAELLTPTNAYVIYPEMKVYFNSDGNSSLYKNTMDFANEYFNTGTINVRGFDYYYEETSNADGITTKYCFDKNNELKYIISTTAQGTVTEEIKEYSKDIDYSLFQIPADYVLEQ